ncbi:MAG: hypothetical protein US50_C0064G0007 [Candidatus Nomurabacteria bacterium GW2011_GWB1_37_5]|uniref:Uncharacterized protein n=1 Tax=Candidatus Nomurabacteria bacterium GW2011_GWB1_37_5 TaxID=1618742 RepID=A0A0G0H676_9BACT|nr:MAG: hypothetical protein US50_C0064G0007 [Candidatus Nomurabacteria bacterium GW2011_GWB1_37_5]
MKKIALFLLCIAFLHTTQVSAQTDLTESNLRSCVDQFAKTNSELLAFMRDTSSVFDKPLTTEANINSAFLLTSNIADQTLANIKKLHKYTKKQYKLCNRLMKRHPDVDICMPCEVPPIFIVGSIKIVTLDAIVVSKGLEELKCKDISPAALLILQEKLENIIAINTEVKDMCFAMLEHTISSH